MRELKIGIVGVGYIGDRHIDAIRRIPGTRVAALADPFVARAKEIAADLGAAVYETAEEMLEKEDLDVVHNCTPTSLHYSINKAVIQAGIHLYCEKPLSLDALEGEKLAALLEEHPVANGVNLNYRMNALLQDVHQRNAAGEYGRPFMVTASYIQDWMMMEDDYDWRLDPKLGGASRAVADIGSHLFDTSQYVLGKKITAVNAQLMVMHPTRRQHEKTGGTFSKEKGKLLREIRVENEDAASIMVRFEDGTSGLFQVSQISAGHKNDMRLRFDFETCSCEWRQEENNLLYVGRRDEPNQVVHREAAVLTPEARAFTGLPSGHPEGWNDVLYQAVNAFYRSIRDGSYKSGQVPYATIRDGAWIMKIIEACLASSKCGLWIDVQTGEKLWQNT